MKKFAFVTVLFTGFLLFPVGCSKENTVIEAPTEETDDESAMEGISDEEYDKAMEEDMNG